MKRIRVLVPLFLLSTSMAPSPSAEARTGACAGVGHMQTVPLSVRPDRANFGTFLMTFDTGGACAPAPSFSASGTIAGSCALAVGHGTTNAGEPFVFRAVAGTIVFSGTVVGQSGWVEDPTNAGLCASDSETGFLVGGTLALVTAGNVHLRACAGGGVLETVTGLSASIASTVTTSFGLTFHLVTCLPSGGLTATGTLTGNCTLAEGSGTTLLGESFQFTAAGGVLAFSGDLVGVATWAEDPLNATTCAAGNERHFSIRGAVAVVRA